MVERIFDSILPLYVVPIPSHATLAANGSADGATSFGIGPLDQDCAPSTYASSSSFMTTFLPLNFWLLAAPISSTTGATSPQLGAYPQTPCVRKHLTVQLERGKSDGQRVDATFFYC